MKNKIKINILFDFKKASGGGNQLLKALKKQFLQMGFYEENPVKSQVVIINSYQKLIIAMIYKLFYPKKIFIHRIDGPISRYRGIDTGEDARIYKINQMIADGTIFQSEWSRYANYQHGYKKNNFETTIKNASDNGIFNTKGKVEFARTRKTKLIMVSWSSNWNKGFETYRFLDNRIDLSRFEMTFIGNSPIKFKNIRMMPPLDSRELAHELKKHDIYITASKNDPCSNSLIEALSCGLPSIARCSGGHPEIVKKGGELFVTEKELIEKINQVASNYDSYQKNIAVINLPKATKCYLNLIRSIEEQLLNNKYQLKKINLFATLKFLILTIFKK